MGALSERLDEGGWENFTVLTILAACAWLKTLSSNATMAMPFWQEQQWTDQPKLATTAALLHQTMGCPAA